MRQSKGNTSRGRIPDDGNQTLSAGDRYGPSSSPAVPRQNFVHSKKMVQFNLFPREHLNTTRDLNGSRPSVGISLYIKDGKGWNDATPRSYFKLAIAALVLSKSTLAGCSRHVYVSKEMSWECAPENETPEYPEAQTVRFKFVEAPRYQEEVSGKGAVRPVESRW